MEYSIQALSRLSGVTTRTLRWYDEIGLLKPSRVAESGYRYYGPAEVDRLQDILYYRALGVELARIKRCLDDPSFDRLAALRPAAPDFALMWDNAYCLHEVYGEFVPFRDMLTLCREAGNADMVYEFASTSKITFPGAGVAVMAASEANLKYLSGLLGAQTISYDKVNQLRHVRFLQDKAHVLELMQRHAAILRPKFEAVLAALRGIAPLGIASWTEPKGGYFVSCDAMPGTAKRTLALCAGAGVTMTPAGATYPGGNDPADSNIRIAPSFPPVEELEQAMQIFCLALRMAALEKLGI